MICIVIIEDDFHSIHINVFRYCCHFLEIPVYCVTSRTAVPRQQKPLCAAAMVPKKTKCFIHLMVLYHFMVLQCMLHHCATYITIRLSCIMCSVRCTRAIFSVCTLCRLIHKALSLCACSLRPLSRHTSLHCFSTSSQSACIRYDWHSSGL